MGLGTFTEYNKSLKLAHVVGWMHFKLLFVHWLRQFLHKQQLKVHRLAQRYVVKEYKISGLGSPKKIFFALRAK